MEPPLGSSSLRLPFPASASLHRPCSWALSSGWWLRGSSAFLFFLTLPTSLVFAFWLQAAFRAAFRNRLGSWLLQILPPKTPKPVEVDPVTLNP